MTHFEIGAEVEVKFVGKIVGISMDSSGQIRYKVDKGMFLPMALDLKEKDITLIKGA